MANPPNSPRFTETCLIHSLTSLTLSTIGFPRFVPASGSILRILPITLAGILGSRLDHLLTVQTDFCFCHNNLSCLLHYNTLFPICIVGAANGANSFLVIPDITHTSPCTANNSPLINTVVFVVVTTDLFPGKQGKGINGFSFNPFTGVGCDPL